jgi:hypothetical protein
LQAQDAHRLEQTERTQTVSIGGVFGGLEAHLHMALSCEIVNLGRSHFLQEANEISCVGQITIMKKEACLLFMRIDIDVVDAGGVEGGRPAFDAVNYIAFFQKQSGQKGAILPRHSGNQRDLVCHSCVSPNELSHRYSA